MEWSEVLEKDPVYLNLGGSANCHPKKDYENYISVDIDPPKKDWAVKHDIREPFPLPDNVVSRIHSEDFMEHILPEEIKKLINECYRVLKPGGLMRVGVPDYNNPKDRESIEKNEDTRFPLHVTLTTYEMMKNIVESSPFPRFRFYQYWDGDTFVHNDIDYSLGMIKRTPENDPRCNKNSPGKAIKYSFRDFLYVVKRGFSVSELNMNTRKGHPLHITSIVFDLYKY
jgi:predicted SAM-dependent methyltransferase